MVTRRLDLLSAARCSGEQILDEIKVERLIFRDVIFEIHHLDAKIDSLDRRIGCRGGQDVFLAQDRGIALDKKTSPLIRIGDQALADNDAFKGLQLDL